MAWLFLLAGLGIGFWAIARFYLRGVDLGRYDAPVAAPFGQRSAPSAEHEAVVARLAEYGLGAVEGPRHRRLTLGRLAVMRQKFDQVGEAQPLPVKISTARVGGVPGEWVVADGADAGRRLLYIHGGAWIIGSPRSHRIMTAALSRCTGAAVLAIDYRLMPEHHRLDAVCDSRSAYGWMLQNGPDGPGPATQVLVAGDSAGGNLALALLNWARDDPQVRAPDCAVVFSPSVDTTMSAASFKSNAASDVMLGPALGRLVRLPLSIRLWILWLGSRIRPCDPLVSPIFADLSGLPPTLVLASEVEMLRDDARRYVNKARASGSPAELATWPWMLHVWPMFTMPEAREAFDRIEAFVLAVAPRERRLMAR